MGQQVVRDLCEVHCSSGALWWQTLEFLGEHGFLGGRGEEKQEVYSSATVLFLKKREGSVYGSLLSSLILALDCIMSLVRQSNVSRSHQTDAMVT